MGATTKPIRDKLKLPDSMVIKSKTKSFFTNLFMYTLLIIISFIILFPFISKISSSFMSIEDMYDRTVSFIPRHATLDMYQMVIKSVNYLPTTLRTLGLSLLCALPQTIICACTGYALAKLKTKFSKICMGLVVMTILIPPQIILVPLYLKFRFFDIFGILKLLTGESINLINLNGGIWAFIILSITGMGFKNGIFIFLLRQFYKGVPEELEEAAYIDGCSIFKTYFKIICPISIPMMITIFIFSFAWQWTDTFYAGLFLKSNAVLANSVFAMSVESVGTGDFYKTAAIQTAVILAIIPIVIVYIFAQKKIIAGIERSGIVG